MGAWLPGTTNQTLQMAVLNFMTPSATRDCASFKAGATMVATQSGLAIPKDYKGRSGQICIPRPMCFRQNSTRKTHQTPERPVYLSSLNRLAKHYLPVISGQHVTQGPGVGQRRKKLSSPGHQHHGQALFLKAYYIFSCIAL